ncbi:MAG: peptidyl-prolyl cis-trans isomerase [Planctomycetota bacterium]
MLRPRPSAALATLLLLLALGPGRARAQDGDARRYPDGVVAIVDGVPITRYELELSCQLRGDYRELTPGSSARRKIQQEELEQLVQQRVLVNKARAEQVELDEHDEKRLQLDLGRQGMRYGGGEGLKQALERIGVPYDYFVARQKANVLVSKLLVKSVPRDIFVTPAEARRHYERNLAKYSRKGVTRLRQIIAYPDKDEAVREAPAATRWQGPWDAQRYMEGLRARLLAGEDFAAVAKDGSQGPKHDEEVVISTASSLDEVFIRPLGNTIQALKPGQTSEVIKTVRGSFYVIRLIDRQEPGPLPIEEVQREIELELKEKAWQQRIQAFIEGERKQATVRTFLPSQPK